MALAAAVALVTLLPLGFVLADTASVGWDQAWDLIVRPRVGQLLAHTLQLGLGSMVASAALGTALAWLVERTDLPGARPLGAVLAAPLAVPAFVTSFAWVSLTPRVQSLPGAVLVLTLAYVPLVYLPVAGALRGLDPALEETARALGQGPGATFRRVVLPQLRPAVLGGTLLVGLHLLAEFGALQLLRFPTFTTAIYDQYQSASEGPAASTLAAVLVVLCCGLLAAELRLRGARRYARVGAGTARTAERARLGRWTLPALLAVGVVVAASVGVPLYAVLRWLVAGGSAGPSAREVLRATGSTIGLAAGAAVLTTAACVPLAIVAERRRGPIGSALERASAIANGLPGIVVALALVSVALRFSAPLYQTTLLLLVAYAVLFLPRATVSVRAALAQAPPALDDVASSLGLGRWAAMRRVTLPLLLPGMGAGATLVFIGASTELTATLLLAPLGTSTLATEFWTQTSQIAYAAAAPYAALMVAISAPATFLLTRHLRRGGAA